MLKVIQRVAWPVLLALPILILGCCPLERAQYPRKGVILDIWEIVDEGPWKVENGVIVCPSSSDIQLLNYREPVGVPLEVEVEIALLGRGPTDGKMVGFLDKQGNWAAVSLDDDYPNTLAIYSGKKDVRDRRSIFSATTTPSTAPSSLARSRTWASRKSERRRLHLANLLSWKDV